MLGEFKAFNTWFNVSNEFSIFKKDFIIMTYLINRSQIYSEIAYTNIPEFYHVNIFLQYPKLYFSTGIDCNTLHIKF